MRNTHIFRGVAFLAISLFSSILPAFADSTPPGQTPMPNNIQGQSSVQTQSAPSNVTQQAQTKQEQALRKMRYDECIAANPGDTSYCNCVADGGVKLNTNVPFVGKCINKDSSGGTGSTTSTAFSDLIGGLSKMVVTAILIVSFMFIIIGGVQWASGNPKEGRDKIKKVAIGLAILGASGAILRLINPNFFK